MNTFCLCELYFLLQHTEQEDIRTQHRQADNMERGFLLNLGVKYSIFYAGVTIFIVYLGSQLLNYAFGFAALIMLLGALVITPLLFGTSDAGLDTVEAGGVAGFQDITNPSQYQPDGFALPSKLQIGFYLIGLAAYSAVALLIVV